MRRARYGIKALLLNLPFWFVFTHGLSAQTVTVWLTCDDQAKKLQPQPSVVFSTGTTATNPIIVDETQKYQTIEGFGASFTDTTGYALNELATPALRDAAMTNLFTRNGGGIGLSFVRNPMGASDLSRSILSILASSLNKRLSSRSALRSDTNR